MLLLGTGSFLFPAHVSPALASLGAISPVVQAALGPFVDQSAEGHIFPGAGFAQPGVAVAGLGSHPGGLGRGEEQWNVIHTWEQKITCICYCFHMYSVEKILERRILILSEEKGKKKHHLVMGAWISCSNFSGENVYFLSLLMTQ